MMQNKISAKPTSARKPRRKVRIPAHLTEEQIKFLEENGIPLDSGFAKAWGLFAGQIYFVDGEDENAPAEPEWDGRIIR